MEGEKTEKQVITQDFSGINLNKPTVNFDVDRFEAAIIKKGYNVYHTRALRCPCINRGTGSALPNCENCSGLGWFYVDKTLTKALMQNIGNNKKFEAWSETNSGTVTVSSLFRDDVTYMDRFDLIDLKSNFSQILYLQQYNGIVFAFTIYEPLEVRNIYEFIDSSQPLRPLFDLLQKPDDWDYYIDTNKIVFNPAKFNEGSSVTVRYVHTPVYCIIDITREIFKTKNAGCSVGCDENDLSFRGMPQRSIGRRLHYLWNANNLSGTKEFDNTVYKNDPNIII